LKAMTISDQRLIDCLKVAYGIEAAAITQLSGGADLNASVYKVEGSGQSYFVKLKEGHQHQISIDVLEFLHDRGIRQIIPPVKTVLGLSMHLLEQYTLLVYPFVEGQDGFTMPLSPDQWILFGKVMRQLHDLAVPTSLQVRLEDYSAQWRHAVRALYQKIDDGLSADQVAMRLLQVMGEQRTTILRLVDRAEQLAEMISRMTPKLVLCHSDIHGGNLLIGKNGSLAIVDWDEPIFAPKERDLMFIGGGVANVWNDPGEEALFYQGYGRTEINREILAYYRHERIVEDIAIYGQQLLLSSAGGQKRQESYQHFIDMFEPRGVVEIACETD
jgi:spectinomycin phosphotransferase